MTLRVVKKYHLLYGEHMALYRLLRNRAGVKTPKQSQAIPISIMQDGDIFKTYFRINSHRKCYEVKLKNLGFKYAEGDLVKVHLQSKSAASIAVGHQHEHEGTLHALRSIYRRHGILGMWRGAAGAVPRLAVGSASQLGSYYVCKEYLEESQMISNEKSLWNTIVASFMGGLAAGIFMTPLDVISTRLYNQGVDAQGRGKLYNGYLDCMQKLWIKEGFFGFYKGFVPCFARIGPHTVLCLVFWDLLKECQKSLYDKFGETNKKTL